MKPRLLLVAAACCLGIGTVSCGAGGGNVYVGVGVVGPYYGGYGGYRGPYAGRPPRYWDDDDLTLAPLEGPLWADPSPATGPQVQASDAAR
jgi:hypothetical protein